MRFQIHWTRDLTALAVTVAIFALLLISAAGSEGRRSAGAGPAPQLGTPGQVVTARDVFDPAGERVEEEVSSPARGSEEAAADRAEEREAQPSEPAEASDPDPAAESPETTPQRQPLPTEVERSPKQVESMSPAEIRRAVEDYRRWFHEGQFELTLDHARLSVEDLRELTAFWVLTSGTGYRLRVSRLGQVGPCDAVPGGMLVGDLNDEKWPASVRSAARTRFGPGYKATAQFALIDKAALLIYRALARELGRHDLTPGTEFVLRIRRDAGILKTEVVGKKRGPAAARKQERSQF